MPSESLSSDDAPDPDAQPTAPPPATPHGFNRFTMHEAARIKGVSYHTVSRAIRSGKLSSQRSGRMVLIAGDDLAAWHPMRERAPLQYRYRRPEPVSMPGVVELASGERYELARRLTAIYEAVEASALADNRDDFRRVIVHRFAQAMEFDRVAVWSITPDRSEIVLIASHGAWFAPGDEPAEPPRIPFDPGTMFASPPDVYEGIDCWGSRPLPIRMNRVFSASLVANGLLVGYVLGDRNGERFELTSSQIDLGKGLATHFANIIMLRRSYDLEVIRHRQALEEATEYARIIETATRAFNEDPGLTHVVRQMSRDATRLTGAHAGGVVLAAKNGTFVRYFNRDGIDLPIEQVPHDPALLPGTARAFATGKPSLVSWPEMNENERSYLQMNGSLSCLTLPLNVDGELAGVMLIEFREEQAVLSPRQISMCETLAATCVAALLKQRLHDALAAERALLRSPADD